MTELINVPELYVPSTLFDGSYVDKRQPVGKYGMVCPCHGTKQHVFPTTASFAAHQKTAMHKNWLQEMTAQRNNHYAELMSYKQICKQQQTLIAQLEKELRVKQHSVDTLLSLFSAPAPVTDLLD